MVSAWRNFKNIFSRPLFTVIFRPEMLKISPIFHFDWANNGQICHILCVKKSPPQDLIKKTLVVSTCYTYYYVVPQ